MKRILQFILIVALLASSAYVVLYYWTVDGNAEKLRELPTTLLSAIIVYIALQLLKRFIKKKIEWFDWFYYIGLIAVLLPLMLVTASSDWIFDITQYGSLFLVLPPLIELLQFIAAKK